MRETFSIWKLILDWTRIEFYINRVSSQIDPWPPLTLLIKPPDSSLDELKLISKLIRAGTFFPLRILYGEWTVRKTDKQSQSFFSKIFF